MNTWANVFFTSSSMFFSPCVFVLVRSFERTTEYPDSLFCILACPLCWYEKWNIKRCISKSTSIVVPAFLSVQHIFLSFFRALLVSFSIASSFPFVPFNISLWRWVIWTCNRPQSFMRRKNAHICLLYLTTAKEKPFCINGKVGKKMKCYYNNKYCYLSKLIQRWHILLRRMTFFRVKFVWELIHKRHPLKYEFIF